MHYFHSPDPARAAPLAVARLDDALLVARWTATCRPREAAPRGGRSAVPPVPDAEPLHVAGIPLAPSADFHGRAATESDRRSRLAELVRGDGRSWPTS